MARRIISLTFSLILTITALTACETVEGAGQDLENAGQSIQNAAQE